MDSSKRSRARSGGGAGARAAGRAARAASKRDQRARALRSPEAKARQARARERSSASAFAESEPVVPSHRGIYPGHMTAQMARKLSPMKTLNAWFSMVAFRYPARLTMVIFLFLIAVTTGALLLPASTAPGKSTTFVDAFFTAASSVCVTGLTVVDTATHWSIFGQVVLAAAITLGGLGVMTMASLLALVVSRRLGVTQRMLSAEDTRGRISDAGALVVGVLVTTVTVELVLFLMILPAFLQQGHTFAGAAWDALFTAISVFNNAGFVNLPEGLSPYIGNWGVVMPLMLAAFVGAIGFPVITDLKSNWRTPKRWSLHTKLTLSTYLGLAALSGVVVAVLEWNNPGTFGPLTTSEKILNSFVEAINPRSLGVSIVDVGNMTSASWLVTDISMFIGGGSGSHAGGIKVATFAVVVMAAWAEARGLRDVEAFHRRIPHETLRQAVSVLLAAAILVLSVAGALLIMTPFSLDRVLFEVISAFGTVGLSTGITPLLPAAAKTLLGFLMVVGRVGPMTLATALALRQEKSLIRYPEERPIVG